MHDAAPAHIQEEAESIFNDDEDLDVQALEEYNDSFGDPPTNSISPWQARSE
jgi:hypothetical protein